jgi:hypothetical protein
MIPAFITSPALLIAAIAGTGALMGGVIVWARNRQRRAAQAARRPNPRRL